MSHEQFNEWIAKDIIEPIGTEGTNSILAKIGLLVAQFMGIKDVTMQSFKHWESVEDAEADPEIMFNSLEMIGGRRT